MKRAAATKARKRPAEPSAGAATAQRSKKTAQAARAEAPRLSATDKRTFRTKLLGWYRAQGRSLPWRETDDPYHILVSEVMLQQTQVDRVLPKYHEWLEKYPSLDALARADDDEVAEAWRPLGYNIRPRRLQSIAREAVARFGGRLPSDEATLRSFKGIGPYTAGAVMSFAFRKRAAILDTNVARVLFRIFVGDGDPDAHAMQRHLWALSREVLPRTHADVFDFNQALMDFGALQCPARKPQCPTCPLSRLCRWRKASKGSRLALQHFSRPDPLTPATARRPHRRPLPRGGKGATS